LNIERFHPNVVIIWCGVNDSWNVAERKSTSAGVALWIDTAAAHSRLYRLIRVWLHDRELEQQAAPALARDGTRFSIDADRPLDERGTQTVRWGSVVEHIQGEPEPITDEAMEHQAAEDFAEMIKYARAVHVPIVFVTYPLEFGHYGAANRAIRQVAE